MGDGTTESRAEATPVIVTGELDGKTIVDISAGGSHSMVLTCMFVFLILFS